MRITNFRDHFKITESPRLPVEYATVTCSWLFGLFKADVRVFKMHGVWRFMSTGEASHMHALENLAHAYEARKYDVR